VRAVPESPVVVGINRTQDGSVSVARATGYVASLQKERLSRRKHHWECDGAHFDRGLLARGRPVRPTGEDGTPADFTILGVGDVARAGWGAGNRAATLGLHAPGGTVFTAATTDWSRVLAQGSPAVAQITRNVLDRLG